MTITPINLRENARAGFLRPSLIDLAECSALAGVTSLVPPFPRAVSPTEAFPFYRNAAQTPMRVWLKYAISDLMEFPADEHDARVVAEELAVREVGRPLHAHEARLIGEAVRDMLTALTITAECAAEDAARAFARSAWETNGRFANVGMFMEEARAQQLAHAESDKRFLRQADVDALVEAVSYVWHEVKAQDRANLAETQAALATPRRLFA